MKIKYWTLTALLIGCTSQPVAPSGPIHFTSEEIPYSGDAEMLLDLPYEEIISALKKDYSNFDPLLVMETGDLETFLQKYEGHVTEEDTADLLHRIYSMNDLTGEKKFLPETSIDLSWEGDQSCEEFIFAHLQNWPGPFTESENPFFSTVFKRGDEWEDQGNILEISAFTIPWDGVGSEEADSRLKLTCRERFEDVGGTFDQEVTAVLYYNEGKLAEVLTQDANEIDFNDGDIFQVIRYEYNDDGMPSQKITWGANIIANQMVIPEIVYFYSEQSLTPQ